MVVVVVGVGQVFYGGGAQGVEVCEGCCALFGGESDEPVGDAVQVDCPLFAHHSSQGRLSDSKFRDEKGTTAMGQSLSSMLH